MRGDVSVCDPFFWFKSCRRIVLMKFQDTYLRMHPPARASVALSSSRKCSASFSILYARFDELWHENGLKMGSHLGKTCSPETSPKRIAPCVPLTPSNTPHSSVLRES